MTVQGPRGVLIPIFGGASILLLSPRSKCTSPAETGHESLRPSVFDACHSIVAGRVRHFRRSIGEI
jgi:hypothetical protein